MWQNYIYFVLIQTVIIFTVAQELYLEPPRIEDIDVSIRQDPGTISYRLPNNTVPLEYDLTLRTRIDLGQFNFTGTVKILIRATEFTNNITLHYRQTTILSPLIIETTTLPVQVIPNNGGEYDNVTQLYVINVPGGLQANTNYRLTINYEGELRNDNRGFYRSSYYVNNIQRWLATTQFESTDARHGFPCYDEPAIKATYKVRIEHGPSYTAISNMPATAQSPIVNPLDGTHTTEFEETPLISTYLMAFIVSDFTYLSNSNNPNSRLPHRAFGRSNKIQEGELMLRDGELILDAIADYVSTPYSLPKLDQAAIPDFAPGAMENWGLVTYREERFFWNTSVDIYTKKTAIVTVIAHELGHQWFGNLVGPKWWTYIWLNEGFANLFEHIGTDLVYPDWKIMDYYVAATLQSVFSSDALTSTRPMTHYVESHTAVAALFDNIAYAKSGCVLRMFMHALTEPTFKKGLRYYLADKGFSDATEEDLFAALNRAAQEDNALPTGIDVETVMSTWTRQPGFPVLRVNRNYETGAIALNQQRYFSSAQTVADQTVYAIPYNFYTSQSSASALTNTKADYWLTARDGNVPATQLTGVTANDWVLFNNQESGYYRVLYDADNYVLIADALQNEDRSKIHLVSRAQLFDDTYNFVLTNSLNYGHFLNLTKSLQNETEYVPWRSASPGITAINRLFSGNELYPRFGQYISTRIESLFNAIGVEDVENEPQQLKYARPIAIEWACRNKNQLCLDATKAKLRDLIDNNREFHQNIRPQLYCAALRTSTADEYWFVWNRLLASTDSAYRNQLFTALGCQLDEDLLKEYLQFSLTSTNLNSSIVLTNADQVRVFQSIYPNSIGARHLALDFAIAHIDEAGERWGTLNNVLTGLAQYITNEALRDKFTILVELVETKGYGTSNSITSARNTVAANTAWETQHSALISNWLNENFPSSGVHVTVSLFLIFVSIVASKLL